MNESVTKEVFTSIYKNKLWGQNQNKRFYSGDGSHDPQVVVPYVNNVKTFLNSYDLIVGKKPNVVDFGCGDFAIGSQLREFCGEYIACDIVEDLIAYNNNRFNELDVQFLPLDIVEDELPKGDVAFVRQVFQHLSNSQIIKVIEKIKNNFDYLIVTEHLPSEDNFVYNLEIPKVGEWRCGINSGVILSYAPFNLKKEFERTLIQVVGNGGFGVIRTTLHKFN
jgi:hypothetical protein